MTLLYKAGIGNLKPQSQFWLMEMLAKKMSKLAWLIMEDQMAHSCPEPPVSSAATSSATLPAALMWLCSCSLAGGLSICSKDELMQPELSRGQRFAMYGGYQGHKLWSGHFAIPWSKMLERLQRIKDNRAVGRKCIRKSLGGEHMHISKPRELCLILPSTTITSHSCSDISILYDFTKIIINSNLNTSVFRIKVMLQHNLSALQKMDWSKYMLFKISNALFIQSHTEINGVWCYPVWVSDLLFLKSHKQNWVYFFKSLVLSFIFKGLNRLCWFKQRG